MPTSTPNHSKPKPTDDLERLDPVIAAQFIEQEHRTVRVWKNWRKYKNHKDDRLAEAAQKRWSFLLLSLVFPFSSAGSAGTISWLALCTVGLSIYSTYIAENTLSVARAGLQTQLAELQIQIDALESQTSANNASIRRQAITALAGESPPQIRMRHLLDLIAAYPENNNFQDLNLKGINFTQVPSGDLFKGVALDGSHFNGATLHIMDMTNTEMRGVVLKNVDIMDSTLASANLDEADIIGAKFFLGTIQDATLQNATLEKVVFYQTNVSNVDFTTAYLDGVEFWGCEGIGTAHFSKAQCATITVKFNKNNLICHYPHNSRRT